MLPEIQKKFRETMFIFYGNMPVSDLKLRELIHCYCSGWGDCLAFANDGMAVKKFIEATSFISDKRWYPEREWRWWAYI